MQTHTGTVYLAASWKMQRTIAYRQALERLRKQFPDCIVEDASKVWKARDYATEWPALVAGLAAITL